MALSVIAAHAYITSVSTQLSLEQLSKTSKNSSFKYSACRASGLRTHLVNRLQVCTCKHMRVLVLLCTYLCVSCHFLSKQLSTTVSGRVMRELSFSALLWTEGVDILAAIGVCVCLCVCMEWAYILAGSSLYRWSSSRWINHRKFLPLSKLALLRERTVHPPRPSPIATFYT